MNESTIGIIGGADGPTAILVSGTPIVPIIITAAVIVGITLAVVYLAVRKK